jgi:hypothetical protein
LEDGEKVAVVELDLSRVELVRRSVLMNRG